MSRDLDSLHHRLRVLEARSDLVEGILDLPPGTPCRGNPSECGLACTANTCPLTNNRVKETGDLMVTLLDEIRWVRALAEEFEALNPSALDRVRLRARRFEITDEIHDLEQALATNGSVQALATLTRAKCEKLKAELASINIVLDRRSS